MDEQTAIIRKPGTFTPENAAQMAARAHEARREAAQHRHQILSSLPANADERRRYERILQQIDLVDERIAACYDDEILPKLVNAKDTLYHMLFPRRGSLKPRMEKRNVAPDASQFIDVPIQPDAGNMSETGTK